MEQKVFQSGHLQSGSFDPETGTMTITFANGQTYIGKDVPPVMWKGLSQATSPGSFFHSSLKPMIKFERI